MTFRDEEGDMPKGPTSADVAREAGVSQSTVSYVMSGKRPISPETRRRVQEAIDRLTYEPHAGARALAGHRTSTIAVVVPMKPEAGAQRLMMFVEEIVLAARRRDHDVLLVTADEGPAGLRRVAGRSLCDAVVVMEVGTEDERVAVARSLPLPVVFIGIPGDSTGLDCLDFDFEGAGGLLVAELADLGHRTVDVLGWGPDAVAQGINYVPRFERGARATAAERGVELRWHRPAGEADVRGAVDRALDSGEVPGLVLVTAIPETLRALSDRGRRPGRDADVVGLATDSEAESYGLTAASTQPRDVSRRVMERVFALIDDDTVPGRGPELVPAVLARRGSTRAARPAG
ncbi:LacI family DNA-binding transcriptional regulator [Krasilnikoviella flava]|uniref:DNA-binding transcriptional regulator, LacI/PurR family n=1 Tax=Krasilnikoviella flava TaxID=526729 RepID=A0A1T5I6M3_9MICO|nr:LacI family DNA-binding transcriptional regulator [Krasilnikoviella flava]SKC34827.1 DNA-binding transcriptional regulator, LacI/PurR family [Krasilnikoviella flava]